MRTRLDAAAIMLTLALGCTPSEPAGDEAGTGSSGTTSETEGSGSDTGTSTSASDTGTSSSSDVDFVPEPDNNVLSCDPYMQDCPEGEKCVFYGDERGYIDAKCVTILGDQAPGESCTWDGIEAATDDCVLGSFCVDLTPDDGDPSGTCRAFCSASDPACSAGYFCHYLPGRSAPTFCDPICNPLVQDCGPGQGCYVLNTDFGCMPTEGGAAVGAACTLPQQCAPGSTCVIASVVPGCMSESCCSAHCDVTQPDACQAQPGTTCAPFYEGGAPAGLENVGACVALP